MTWQRLQTHKVQTATGVQGGTLRVSLDDSLITQHLLGLNLRSRGGEIVGAESSEGEAVSCAASGKQYTWQRVSRRLEQGLHSVEVSCCGQPCKSLLGCLSDGTRARGIICSGGGSTAPVLPVPPHLPVHLAMQHESLIWCVTELGRVKLLKPYQLLLW